MKQAALDALHLGPRSEAELHETVSRFEAKWRRKVSRRAV